MTARPFCIASFSALRRVAGRSTTQGSASWSGVTHAPEPSASLLSGMSVLTASAAAPLHDRPSRPTSETAQVHENERDIFLLLLPPPSRLPDASACGAAIT